MTHLYNQILNANTNMFYVNSHVILLLLSLILTFPLILPSFVHNYTILSNFEFVENITSNYSINWLANITKESFDITPTGEKPLCNYVGDVRFKDSSPDDLIIGVLMGNVTGYQAFIRSLTSAPIESTVVIITNDPTLLDIPKIDVNFPLKIISIGELPKPFTKNKFLTKVPMFEFLTHFAHFFNRIIMTDITDVVIQEDPFDDTNDWSLLNLNFEKYMVKEDWTNIEWVKQVQSWLLNDAMETEQINAGLIAGYSKIIKDLSLLLLYLWYLPEINTKANDQGIIEYTLLNHFLQDSGLDYITRGRGHLGTFTLFQYTLNDFFPNVTAMHADTTVAVIHKYHEYSMMMPIIRYCNFMGIDDILRE